MAKVYGRLAIITILVFAGVSLWYGRLEERLQGNTSVVKNEAETSSLQKPAESESVKTDYQIILGRNIFKATLESGGRSFGEQPSVEVEDLAETKMQLVLLGTVSGSNEDARAIIRNEKTNIEDIYRVGSELQGSVITKIGRGKVVLQVNGREEVLNIKESEVVPGPRQAASPDAEFSQPEGSRTRPTEVVVPQRRISFRNPPPAVSEPDPAATIQEDSGASLSVGEQDKQGDTQLVPNGESFSPGKGKDENPGQQTK